ncbi:MAG: hypothetical protein DRI95_01165 [Bacteroidetes bacterium]|nr:MAG: hypothetical protein DRI95_01165 [Bacteroidota bacterium]
METAQIKLELFRYIDKLNENKLVQLYDFLVQETDKQKKDFWLMLSEWDRNDIELGIQDLENGKKRDFFEYFEQI